MEKKYTKYLKSKGWKTKSSRLKKLYGNKCCNCGSSSNLHTHHLTYENIYNEPYKDLRPLCSICHDLWHSDSLSQKEIDKIINAGFVPKSVKKRRRKQKNKSNQAKQKAYTLEKGLDIIKKQLLEANENAEGSLKQLCRLHFITLGDKSKKTLSLNNKYLKEKKCVYYVRRNYFKLSALSNYPTHFT